MICCKLNNNASAQDFILNSPAPIYTAIKLTLMYREESLRVKDKSQDYLEIAEYCEVLLSQLINVFQQNINNDFELKTFYRVKQPSYL